MTGFPSDLKHHRSFKKCSELWFEDGSIILEADNGTLFRVYGGHLTRCSSVLNEMLAEAEQSHDLFEGIPLVPMDDSAADLRCFLKALFDLKFYTKRGPEMELEDIISVLRLSTKYNTEVLRTQTLSILSTVFPSRLDVFVTTNEHKWRSRLTPRKLFTLANLAKEADATALLPSILYLCCRRDLVKILDGVETPSGSRAVLDGEIMRRIIIGRRALESLARTWTYSYLYDHNVPFEHQCEDSSRCRQFIHTKAKSIDSYPDVFLDPLAPPSLYQNFDGRVCRSCLRWMEGVVKVSLEHVWTCLPVVFGFPEWGSLVRVSE
ncbi:hypothetical protein ABKN59_002589 [Abortiporus biennis]